MIHLIGRRCIILQRQDVSCCNDKIYHLSFSYNFPNCFHNQSLFHNSRTYKGQPLVLFRKQGCRIHQCQMGICLWKIAQLFLCIEVDIFTEQPQMVCIFQHLVKKASGLFFSACDEQSPYQPECTMVKAEEGMPKSSSLL